MFNCYDLDSPRPENRKLFIVEISPITTKISLKTPTNELLLNQNQFRLIYKDNNVHRSSSVKEIQISEHLKG